jgi:hypothetical protein
MPRVRSRSTKLFAVIAVVALVAPQVLAAPADVVNISAPQVGAEPPATQDIADGDLSVATSTGSLQYGYPIAVPPAKMAPQLSLTYSSQAPIYGGLAAHWTLSGLHDIRWDGSRGLADRERGQDPRDYLHYVSSLAGGRPLVEVTEAKDNTRNRLNRLRRGEDADDFD